MFLRIFAASFIAVAALQWTTIRPFLGLPDYRGCDARGYNDDRYLAFCDNSYGAYDAGGIYLDLESVQKSIRAADVVILGNSRDQCRSLLRRESVAAGQTGDGSGRDGVFPVPAAASEAASHALLLERVAECVADRLLRGSRHDRISLASERSVDHLWPSVKAIPGRTFRRWVGSRRRTSGCCCDGVPECDRNFGRMRHLD